MAITTLDQGVAAPKTTTPFVLSSIGSQAAGNLVSLWRAGGFPAAAAIPSAATVPVDTDGGFIFANPTAPAITQLWRATAAGSIAGMLVLYDRLSHMGGLSGTSTSAQPVNTAAITRGDTSGAGVEAFLEWYTATGGTGVTATVSWTDSGNTSGRSTAVTLAATRPAGFLAPIPWAAGTYGTKSVQSVTLSATTGTAGNFGVTLARRICEIPISLANISPGPLDPVTLGLPQIPDDACLWMAFLTSGTSTGQIVGSLQLAQG